MADEVDNEENDAGTVHEYKRMTADDLHKISTNLKPAGSLGADQDTKPYSQNVAEIANKQEQPKQAVKIGEQAVPQ